MKITLNSVVLTGLKFIMGIKIIKEEIPLPEI